MTNFEFIMSKMTDRNLTELFFEKSVYAKEGSFVRDIYTAFSNWRKSISKHNGNVYHIERKENPSVFQTSFFHFYEEEKNIGNSRNCDIAIARTDKLSFQVWLTKQYNPEEWKK